MSTIQLNSLQVEAEELTEASAPLREAFDVGGWQVDPDTSRLQAVNGSLTVQLEPRLMRLLCFLAANQQRVLSRDELVTELWPTVIVNENSLTRAISELRKQLNRDCESYINYIETIPKKGYKLADLSSQSNSVEAEQSQQSNFAWRFRQFTALGGSSIRSPLPAFALALVLAAWLGSNHGPMIASPNSNNVLLSDELIESEPQYFGGHITLSTDEQFPINSQNMEPPVVESGGDRYAYIDYDQTGSTIFVGSLSEMTEPTAVYNCSDFLYNLSWSPVGNNLLFAAKPKMTTTALYPKHVKTAALMILNLETFLANRLIPEKPTNAPTSTESNLS